MSRARPARFDVARNCQRIRLTGIARNEYRMESRPRGEDPGLIGVGSLADPYSLPSSIGFSDITGSTQVSPRLVSGENTGVFILAGQSNSPGASYVNAAY